VHAFCFASSPCLCEGARWARDASEPSGKVDESAGAAGLAAIFFEGSQWHVLKT